MKWPFVTRHALEGDVPLLDFKKRSKLRWARQAGVVSLIGLCVCGWSINGARAEMRDLQDKPGGMCSAKYVPITNTTEYCGALKSSRDWKVEYSTALGTGADPKRFKSIDWHFWYHDRRIAKSNTNFVKIGWRFPMIINLENEIAAGHLLRMNYLMPTTNETNGNRFSHQAAGRSSGGHVGSLCAAQMNSVTPGATYEEGGNDNQQSSKNRNWIINRLLKDSPKPIFVSFFLAALISAIGVTLNCTEGRVGFWLGGFLIFAGLGTMIFPWWVFVLKWCAY